eukprot:jgi/Botrbrau1/13337/Bobra.0334s0013.1
MDSDDESSSSGGDSNMSDGGYGGPGVANPGLQPAIQMGQGNMHWDDALSAEDDSDDSSDASSNDNGDDLGVAGNPMPLEAEAEVAGPVGAVPPFDDGSEEEDRFSSSDDESGEGEAAPDSSDSSSSSGEESEDTGGQPDFDVQHIGAMLAGEPSPQPSPSQVSGRGPPRACCRGPDESGTGTSGTDMSRQCKRPCLRGDRSADGPGRSSAGPAQDAGGAGPSSGPSPSSASRGRNYNRPAPTQNPRVVMCTVCDCQVYDGSEGRGWTTHITGIQHRRMVLALENGVSRNELIVSMFEDISNVGRNRRSSPSKGSLPGGPYTTGFIKGRALPPEEQLPETLAVPMPQQYTLPAVSETERRISELSSALHIELLAHVGASDVGRFNAAMGRLSAQYLRRAWHYLSTKLGEAEQSGGLLHIPTASPSVVACLSARLPEITCRHLILSLASCHPGDFGAASTALCLLGESVMRCAGLGTLEITGPVWSQASPASHALAQLPRLWGKVFKALHPAILHRLSQVQIKTNLASEVRSDDVESLKTEGAAATPTRRLAPLLVLHPKMNAVPHPLSSLPQEVLLKILNLAIPLGVPACQVTVVSQTAARP